MSETRSENGAARTRSLRWMDALWDGASTHDREEGRKEEVLWVFRELARNSRSEGQIREYVPWEPRWW